MSSETSNPRTPALSTDGGRPRGEALTIYVIWLTYGCFYFCRQNLSAALPGIEHEFGYSKANLGLILGASKLTYGIGQFVSGQLAERFRPRVLLAIGMLASAAFNVLFGLGAGFVIEQSAARLRSLLGHAMAGKAAE